MTAAYTIETEQADFFAPAREQLRAMEEHLRSDAALRSGHDGLESYLSAEGRELHRLLMQAHLDLRAERERPVEVRGRDGVEHDRRRRRLRLLKGTFGVVQVSRLAYERDLHQALRPLDAGLNIPGGMFSLGVRRHVAEAAARSSFEETQDQLQLLTGMTLGKRQLEELAALAAEDFSAFYDERQVEDEDTDALLVLTFDGKGIVLREDDLRPATKKAARKSKPKLTTRLTTGEKRNRKRMAQVAAIYSVAPYPRSPADFLPKLKRARSTDGPRPRPFNKRVWASLEREPAEVIREAFEEALRRDPRRQRRWVVLVDGHRDQLATIRKAARDAGVKVTIIVDLMHVTEYLWAAAHAFHAAGSTEAEEWVHQRLLGLLDSQSAGYIARGMRRLAAARGLTKNAPKPVDDCARYLVNNTRHIKYASAIRDGLPVGTGVIEGACRYLINDRMRRARWSLHGAESVLRLRALWASGDLDEYWSFHVGREYQRNHRSRYADEVVPDAIPPKKPRLRLVN